MIPNTENSLTKYKSTKYFHTCVSIVCIYVNTVAVCKSVFLKIKPKFERVCCLATSKRV